MSDTATPALHRESDTLYRQIAEIWREKIVTGEYKPGDALPSERDISESLGVSRIPVREAMKSLEYLGIVKQVRGKGVFVQKTDPGEVLAKIGPFLAPPDAATLSELFDLRILFEGYAAELAAKNRTDADLKTLQASLDLLNASIRDEKSAEEASHRFHQEIAAMAGNRPSSSFSGTSSRSSSKRPAASRSGARSGGKNRSPSIRRSLTRSGIRGRMTPGI